MEPDEEHFHEATGNEGASFDRTYARAALVIWPSDRILAVLNQAGLEATLPYLEELLRNWQAAGPKKRLAHKQQAVDLANLMIATWPERSWHGRGRTEVSELGRMLGLLARLGDASLAERMFTIELAQRGEALALEVADRRETVTPVPSTLDERILAILAEADQPVPFADLRSQCRVRAISLHERIGTLCAAGRVIKTDGGYRLAGP